MRGDGIGSALRVGILCGSSDMSGSIGVDCILGTGALPHTAGVRRPGHDRP
jgi:hypothetical protein